MSSRSIDDVEQAARRKARHIQKNFRQNVNWRMQMTCDLGMGTLPPDRVILLPESESHSLAFRFFD